MVYFLPSVFATSSLGGTFVLSEIVKKKFFPLFSPYIIVSLHTLYIEENKHERT
jgi:hypothetical protein